MESQSDVPGKLEASFVLDAVHIQKLSKYIYVIFILILLFALYFTSLLT